MNRPQITDFMGAGFTLNRAHRQYLENLELWNYVQALDKYVDELEDKIIKDTNNIVMIVGSDPTKLPIAIIDKIGADNIVFVQKQKEEITPQSLQKHSGSLELIKPLPSILIDYDKKETRKGHKRPYKYHR